MATTTARSDKTFPDPSCCAEEYVIPETKICLEKFTNTFLPVREDATKESDFTLDDEGDEDDEENDWDGEVEWNEDEVEEAIDGDVADESAAYLEFLNQEAQKFGSFADDDDEDLDEESLLETPLDKVEPYGMFKHVFLSM